MNTRFKEINTINTILTRAEHDIYIATGIRKKLIAVKYLEPVNEEPLRPEEMMRVIAASQGQPYDDYFNLSRKQEFVHLRMLAAFFLRLYFPGLTLKQIAKLIDVDHTTVIHYLAAANNLVMTEDPDFSPKYDNALIAVTSWLATEE